MPRPLTLAMLGLVVAAAPAAAQRQSPQADATWRARLTCDPLPPITQNPLNVAITLTVQGGVARYERVVLDAQGRPTGSAERGEGPVGRDGSLTLDGLATARTYQYTARYVGRLGANGTGALEGTQEWRAGNAVGQMTRPCRMVLRREGAGE